MCCFSRPVNFVSGTGIFARTDRGNRQFLVYSMVLNAKEDLAMVLPLPVRVGTGERDVTFIDLKDYLTFFEDLDRGFPLPPPPKLSRGVKSASAALAKLEVVSVGSFDASFVPTMDDFPRLDERFRLPPGTWEKLPIYRSYGFAVFKLKKGESKVHPMAFSFPRRDLSSLFFPTVHIHDGEVHPKADFDHVLYCQSSEGERLALTEWRESPKLAGQFMKTDRAKGLIAGDRHCYQRQLRGRLENKDVLIGARV